MAMLVVVLDADASAATLDAASGSRLAYLGITSVAIARDDTTQAVVLEGWAFDTDMHGAEAASIVAGTASRRGLHLVCQSVINRIKIGGTA
jgi:hypothetical protein